MLRNMRAEREAEIAKDETAFPNSPIRVARWFLYSRSVLHHLVFPALPGELDVTEQRELCERWLKKELVSQGILVDVALYADGRGKPRHADAHLARARLRLSRCIPLRLRQGRERARPLLQPTPCFYGRAMSDAAASNPSSPDGVPEKKKPKRKRPCIRLARYSDDEAALFDELAKEARLSDSAFIRISTIGEQGRPRSRRRALDERGRLNLQFLTALNRVGSLVNQGVRALNEIALTAPEAADRDRLADEIAQVKGLLASAIPALHETLAAIRAALAYDWEG
jgi:hypothetical protein